MESTQASFNGKSVGVDRLLVALFALFTAGPLVLFAAGDRGKPIENRRPIDRPPIEVDALLDTTKSAAMDEYLEDALPRRQVAVELDARMDLALGDSPNPAVRLGHDGWYFYNNTFRQPCIGSELRTRLVAELERVSLLVEAAEREVIFAMAPDKASIHPTQVAGDPGCSLVTATGLAGVEPEADLVVGWSALREASTTTSTYREKDTHWTARGAAVFAELLVERLQPDGWLDEVIVERVEERDADLSSLIGVPYEETVEVLTVRTPGQVTVEGTNDRCLDVLPGDAPVVTVFRTEPTSAAPIGPHTLFMHDSFGCDVVPVLGPHFARVDSVNTPDPTAMEIETQLAASETIVWLVAQRNFYGEVVFKDLYGRFAIGLRDEFPTTRVSVEWNGTLGTVRPPQTPGAVTYLQLADGAPDAAVEIGDRRHVLTPDNPFVLLPPNEDAVSFVRHRGAVDVWVVEPRL